MPCKAVFAASVLTSPAGSSIAWQSGTGSSSSTDRVTDTLSGPAHACGLRARAGRTLSWSAEDTRHRTTSCDVGMRSRQNTPTRCRGLVLLGPLLPQDAARCGTDVPTCPSYHRRCHALHDLAGAGRLLARKIIAMLFAPAPIPSHFDRDFPVEMALRPSQIRAAAEESGLLLPINANDRTRYSALKLPVAILAGSRRQARRYL